MTAPASIQHNPAEHCFETTVDGHRAVLDYELENGVMVITHTGVPQAIGGRGIAAELTRAALEHARSNGLKVVPACAYAAAFMQRHGEYTALLG
ncbi:GNAT family N-acetyltransferase [Stenotrophomonas sp. SY1]|uniref:GNAT family N-acetyltransferase n=1 Tax=Stenotrophomonas sp. SY1 TaxID=477235 RepID=UPI001E630B8F|nr:GNAT family N-acetyltransferase [Stenotrophomonas sp. SY1]MCD9086871.1 N-acetyltransferase [Stenotrophomonas sp. SY1]